MLVWSSSNVRIIFTRILTFTSNERPRQRRARHLHGREWIHRLWKPERRRSSQSTVWIRTLGRERFTAMNGWRLLHGNRTSWGPGRAWRLETPEPYLAAAARPVTRQVTQLHTSAFSFRSRRSSGYGFGELMLRSQTTVRGCRGTSSEKASESVLGGEHLLRLQRSSHEDAFRF